MNKTWTKDTYTNQKLEGMLQDETVPGSSCHRCHFAHHSSVLRSSSSKSQSISMTGRWMNTSGSRIVLLEVKVKRTKNKGEGKKQQQTQTNNNIGHNTTP